MKTAPAPTRMNLFSAHEMISDLHTQLVLREAENGVSMYLLLRKRKVKGKKKNQKYIVPKPFFIHLNFICSLMLASYLLVELTYLK